MDSKKIIKNFVIVFWSFISASIVWSFSALSSEILPENIVGLVVMVIIVGVFYRLYILSLTKDNRLIRIILITLFISFYSFVISMFYVALLGVYLLPQNTELILPLSLLGMALISIAPFLNLYFQTQRANSKKGMLNDIKVSLSFSISMITIIYGIAAFYDNSTLVDSLTFVSLFPFGINLLALSVISYLETNMNVSN